MKPRLRSAVLVALPLAIVPGLTGTAPAGPPERSVAEPLLSTPASVDLLAEAPLTLIRGGDPLPGVTTSEGRLSFRVRVRDVVVPYPVLAVTALPGEVLEISVEEVWGEGQPESFRLRAPEGLPPAGRPGVWRWRAPTEPGAVPLRVESPLDGQAVHLNVLVLHPMEEVRDGSLDGYRIGTYRTGPGRSEPPAGFIQGSPEVLDLRVAPHFTLRQFLCKQPGEPPYLALSEPLLLKLEAILEEVRREGIPAETLHVMSAFRTPHYNRAIGNTTDGSRHLWGDAADIFVDLNGNGRMDDLNGDGRVDVNDARFLASLAERVEARGEPHIRPGGLSVYRANAVRGPFVHVDARGHRARW